MTTKLIILDRDGVINYDSPDYIKSPDEWHSIPGSLEAIARLNQAGFTVVVATNQSGVARGYYDLTMLQKIHDKLHRELFALGGKIDHIYFCPHHPDDQCACRKPNLGMFHAIRDQYKIDLSDVYFIGDSYSDMMVAKTLPCKPILVLTSKGDATFKKYPELSNIPHFADLKSAVDFILVNL